jgi:hypothetical protein
MIPDEIRYYDAKRHWTARIAPHLEDERLNAVLVRDFNLYTFGTWRKPFKRGMLPLEFESCDWHLEHRGPIPRFWRYVKHGACHALVNFNLRLAELAEPRREWRIITSEAHSTVWDGGSTLFDLNFLAFGVHPAEAFRLATEGGRILKPGRERRVYLYPHYSQNYTFV